MRFHNIIERRPLSSSIERVVLLTVLCIFLLSEELIFAQKSRGVFVVRSKSKREEDFRKKEGSIGAMVSHVLAKREYKELQQT